jgi:hypothetical protein
VTKKPSSRARKLSEKAKERRIFEEFFAILPSKTSIEYKHIVSIIITRNDAEGGEFLSNSPPLLGRSYPE